MIKLIQRLFLVLLVVVTAFFLIKFFLVNRIDLSGFWAAADTWSTTQDSTEFRYWFAYQFWKGVLVVAAAFLGIALFFSILGMVMGGEKLQQAPKKKKKNKAGDKKSNDKKENKKAAQTA